MNRQIRGQRRPGAGGPVRWVPKLADQLPVLGVDIGGVLVDRVHENADTSFFGSQPMDTPVVTGAVDALAALSKGPFEGRVYLVSKAGWRTAETTRRWLAHIDFFGRTGLSAAHVHFVPKRPDKAPVCEQLGVTHFIDDHVDVLQHLGSVPFRYLFTGGIRPDKVPRNAPSWATVVEDWPALRNRIVNSLA